MSATEPGQRLGLKDMLVFGKFKGQTIEQVYLKDAGYLAWLRQKRLEDNRDPHFFAPEVHVLVDDAIKQDKRLSRQYSAWDVATMGTPPDLSEQAKAAAEPVRDASFAYADSWGAF